VQILPRRLSVSGESCPEASTPGRSAVQGVAGDPTIAPLDSRRHGSADHRYGSLTAASRDFSGHELTSGRKELCLLANVHTGLVALRERFGVAERCAVLVKPDGFTASSSNSSPMEVMQ